MDTTGLREAPGTGQPPDPVARGDEQAELLALVAPLRRFALSRLDSVHDADDLVQETLTRLLTARARLQDENLTGYAFSIARNLVASHYRDADVGRRHARHLADPREPPQPEHLLLAAEDRRALGAALGELPQQQRDQIVEHVVHDVAVSELGGGHGPGAVAAQLARTRARLRLDYLLALRGVTLPTARCRPVLLALSAGDRRRQAALRAAEHVRTCRTCAELHEPLAQRTRVLAGLVPWIPLGALQGHVGRWVRSHPAQSASAGVGAVAAAAAVATLVSTSGTPPHRPAPPPAVTARIRTPLVPLDTTLTGPGGPVLPDPGRLRDLVGGRVRARGVRVLLVPADEGFWVGWGPGHRVWVQLRTHRESPETVRAGQHLTFTGVLVRNDAGFVERVGLDAADGAQELTRQGAHVEVDPDDVTVR